jgi:hypothetical protein
MAETLAERIHRVVQEDVIIHQQKGISDRLRPGVVVEVNPELHGFLLCFFDLRHPGSKLILAVQIIIPVQSVVVLFLIPVPDVVVPPMKP